MSAKKASFLELHCEKIVVAVVALGLVTVVVWQILFVAVQVKVGNETLSLNELSEKLAAKETDLARKLEPDNPSPIELPEAKGESTSEIFQSKLAAQIAPSATLMPNQPSFGKLLVGDSRPTNQWFYQPIFGASEMHGTVVTSDALDEEQIDEEMRGAIEKVTPGFVSRFLTSSASDVTWTTPWAVVNLDALRLEVAKSDNATKPAREVIPRPWINNDSIYMVDVVFERREKKSDGTWSAALVITPAPGQDSWRGQIARADANVSTRDTIFVNLADYNKQLDVVQPPLLPMKGGNFVPPSLGSDPGGVQVDPKLVERQKAERKIDSAQAALARTDADIEKAGGRLEPPPSGGSGSTAGDDSGGKKDKDGGFGMGGGGSMKKGNNGVDIDGESQATKNLRIRLTKKSKSASRDLQKLQEAFAKKFLAADAQIDSAKTPEALAPSFSKMDNVVMWTHDFDVREGATYQYRATIQIYNPFFTRQALLVPDQQKLANGVAVSSETSQWGEEVTIPFTTSFFVTRGSGRDGIGGRRVTVDLFRYVNGELKSTSEDVSVGDPVGKTVGSKTERIDYSTPWYLVDIFDDAAGASESGGVIAVFEQRTKSGEILQEVRTLADKDSEKYKEFKSAVAPTKKVAARAPTGG